MLTSTAVDSWAGEAESSPPFVAVLQVGEGLPAARESRSPAPLIDDQAAPRILIVDDHAANREVLLHLFKRRGYHVEAAEDGYTALAALDEGAFDLVLLDVMMPGMTGFEVLSRIRETLGPSDLAVIMATAKHDSEDVVNALKLGANDYVTKPLDLQVVSARIESQLALRRSMRQIKALEESLRIQNGELQAANKELIAAADRVKQELELAARVQSTFLPSAPVVVPGFDFAWAYRPCDQLAGDALNVFPLCEDHVGMFVLDVSGHGVAASLLSVAATRALSPGPNSMLLTEGELPTPPVMVAERMEALFPFAAPTWQFLTLFYAVLNVKTGELTYSSAGHPPAIQFRRDGTTQLLDQRGCAIGFSGQHCQSTVRIEAGERLYIHSDGIEETMDPEEEQFGLQRTIDVLNANRARPLNESVDTLLAELDGWRRGCAYRDDISLLAFEAR